MMRSKISSKINIYLLSRLRNSFYSIPLYQHHNRFLATLDVEPRLLGLHNNLCHGLQNVHLHREPISGLAFRFLSTNSSEEITPENNNRSHPLHYDTIEDVEPIDLWEEEEETEPEIGDGGDGGGIVLQSCPWGEEALSIARDVLLQFGDDMELFAFKTSPRGYIYVRLDKLPNEYGCPSMDEMEEFSRQYKKKLDEFGAVGKIPDDLALEVSSPGATRLLKVPDDLSRFKDMPMRVSYKEDMDSKTLENYGVFFIESIDVESGTCVWKLADVKENRDPLAKGRPLSRKQKDWRLRLPHAMIKRVTIYLDY